MNLLGFICLHTPDDIKKLRFPPAALVLLIFFLHIVGHKFPFVGENQEQREETKIKKVRRMLVKSDAI